VALNVFTNYFNIATDVDIDFPKVSFLELPSLVVHEEEVREPLAYVLEPQMTPVLECENKVPVIVTNLLY
jgi:hypothetical protein